MRWWGREVKCAKSGLYIHSGGTEIIWDAVLIWLMNTKYTEPCTVKCAWSDFLEWRIVDIIQMQEILVSNFSLIGLTVWIQEVIF